MFKAFFYKISSYASKRKHLFGVFGINNFHFLLKYITREGIMEGG